MRSGRLIHSFLPSAVRSHQPLDGICTTFSSRLLVYSNNSQWILWKWRYKYCCSFEPRWSNLDVNQYLKYIGLVVEWWLDLYPLLA